MSNILTIIKDNMKNIDPKTDNLPPGKPILVNLFGIEVMGESILESNTLEYPGPLPSEFNTKIILSGEFDPAITIKPDKNIEKSFLKPKLAELIDLLNDDDVLHQRKMDK